MKSGITRWKMVPSYRRSLLFLRETGCVHSRLPSASSMKLVTVLGASFSNRRQTIWPSVVSKTAYVPGWRVIRVLSSVIKSESEDALARAGETPALLGGRLCRCRASTCDGDVADFHGTERPVIAGLASHPGNLLHEGHRGRITLAKDGVAAVQVRRRYLGDEKLGTVSIRSGIGHRQTARTIKRQARHDFIAELVAGIARTIARRVTTLNHEVRDYAVEDGPIVERYSMLGGAACRILPVFGTGGETDEVGYRFGCLLLEQPAAQLAGCRVEDGNRFSRGCWFGCGLAWSVFASLRVHCYRNADKPDDHQKLSHSALLRYPPWPRISTDTPDCLYGLGAIKELYDRQFTGCVSRQPAFAG